MQNVVFWFKNFFNQSKFTKYPIWNWLKRWKTEESIDVAASFILWYVCAMWVHDNDWSRIEPRLPYVRSFRIWFDESQHVYVNRVQCTEFSVHTHAYQVLHFPVDEHRTAYCSRCKMKSCAVQISKFYQLVCRCRDSVADAAALVEAHSYTDSFHSSVRSICSFVEPMFSASFFLFSISLSPYSNDRYEMHAILLLKFFSDLLHSLSHSVIYKRWLPFDWIFELKLSFSNLQNFHSSQPSRFMHHSKWEYLIRDFQSHCIRC